MALTLVAHEGSEDGGIDLLESEEERAGPDDEEQG